MGKKQALASHLNKLFIANLPSITEAELKQVFKQYGTIADVHVSGNNENNIFAFIRLDSHANAAKV